MKSVFELLKNFYVQRIAVYCVIAFFSLFVIVPLGDLRIRFTDDHCSRCILYSDVKYNLTNPRVHYFKIRFGEQEVCEYIIAVASLFCLLYSLAAGVLYFFLYRKDNDETRQENKLDLAHYLFFIHVIVEIAVIILVLVSASMISAGFQHLCSSLTGGVGSIKSCQDAQNFIDWRGYDAKNFYICLSVATAGSWLLFVSWLFQGVLGVWKLWSLEMFAFIPLSFCKK